VDEITSDFLRRAIAESELYGEDPWVFLRELGQNSRDAHAAFIQIATRTEGRQASLLFEDDGLGMTLSHARAYLFRLYASSKSDDACAAGRFGVGFWSILRFGATRIEVHSRTLSESFGVVLAGDLSEWKDVRCRRDRQGTTILLVRPDAGVRPDDFDDQVHRSAIRYLAHLRTAGRRPRPLPVSLNGRSIERPFALKSPGELRFRDGAVEGVVGFGPRPYYKLYARGLPVMEGAFLDEIEGKPARTGSKAEREGVAPVFLLNGNNIDVVLSRETVVWNRALRELVRVARRRFDELVSRTIDGSTSTSSAGRLWTLFDSIVRSVGRGPIWMRTSAVVLGLLIVGGSLGHAQ